VLPDNDSWRLYPADYAFPSPNPLAGGVPNSYTVDLAPGAYQLEYKAVKVGDVNCSALAGDFLEPTDRTVFPLYFPEQTLNAGETIKLPVFAGETTQWDGFQLALELLPGLTLETVSGGLNTSMSAENWHLTAQNVLNLSWITGETASIPAGEPLFYLHLSAAQKIHTAEAVLLKKGTLSAEAYPATGSVQTLELYPNAGKKDMAFLSPPQPNPTTGDAILRLQLPQDETVTIQLFTTDGRTAYLRTSMFGKGAHDESIPAEAMPQPGLYLWRLQAGDAIWTGKLQRF
ncbi:MAG: T9SS type A sorting domain-containing protein, partial [Saprospiraceae bacterium]|nr:T9SS type A sorting domain-containing protein [Saprospiraceae bacterium]